MKTMTSKTGPSNPLNGRIPPLEPGDRLTRAEFERRYEAMPNLRKAELIEGVVYVSSPVRADYHGAPQLSFITWLGTYQAFTLGVKGADNATVRLDLGNEPQPDGVLYIEPAHGGQVRISKDGYIEGAPELAGKVAASSVSIDLHDKLRAYQRNGVREYVVWRVLDEAVDWFVLQRKQYRPLRADGKGILRSKIFPGLWLDPAALLRSDLKAVLAVLQQGLNSAEHAAFVARRAKPSGNTT